MDSTGSTLRKSIESAGLETILQDVLDAIEDEIVIINTEHRIIYSNSVLFLPV